MGLLVVISWVEERFSGVFEIRCFFEERGERMIREIQLGAITVPVYAAPHLLSPSAQNYDFCPVENCGKPSFLAESD